MAEEKKWVIITLMLSNSIFLYGERRLKASLRKHTTGKRLLLGTKHTGAVHPLLQILPAPRM